MEVKLDGLQVEMNDESIQENDVFVDFEYEKLSRYILKFYLHARIGRSVHESRFCLKTIHIVDLQNELIEDENEMIQSVVRILVEPMIEIIMTIDQMTHKPEERLH